jgi:hypothetical protein
MTPPPPATIAHGKISKAGLAAAGAETAIVPTVSAAADNDAISKFLIS